MSPAMSYASLVTSRVIWSRTISTSERFSATGAGIQRAIPAGDAREDYKPVTVAGVFESGTQHRCYSPAVMVNIDIGSVLGGAVLAGSAVLSLWVWVGSFMEHGVKRMLQVIGLM